MVLADGGVLTLLRLVDELTTGDCSSLLLCVCVDGEPPGCDCDGMMVAVVVAVVVAVGAAVIAGNDVIVAVVVVAIVAAVVVAVVVDVVGDVVEPVDDCPSELSIFTVDGMATNVMFVGCRDILNVLNLLSGSNTTLSRSSKYELSRFKCSAHSCRNLMHEFNIHWCILYFHELTASSVRIFINETVRPSR